MRIAVIIPNSTMPPEAVALRQRFLQERAARGTDIRVLCNSAGPASIETERERDEAAVEIVRHVASLDLSCIDAIIPWCAADPAIDALRELTEAPVIGPLKASCHFASMLGLRFSVVMPAGSMRMMRQRVEGYGFGPKLTSIRQVDRPVLELRQDIDATISHFSQQIRATADEGADAVVLGCMALFGLAARIDAPVPVIDPALAALSMAQSLVALGRR